MYKIDRWGGGVVQKSFTRTDPIFLLQTTYQIDQWNYIFRDKMTDTPPGATSSWVDLSRLIQFIYFVEMFKLLF